MRYGPSVTTRCARARPAREPGGCECVEAEGLPDHDYAQRDKHGAQRLRPERHVRPSEAARVQSDQHHPADEDDGDSEHEDAVPGHLIAPYRRGQARLQKSRIVPQQPEAHREAGEPNFAKENPALRPAPIAGRKKQDRPHRDEPERRLNHHSSDHRSMFRRCPGSVAWLQHHLARGRPVATQQSCDSGSPRVGAL